MYFRKRKIPSNVFVQFEDSVRAELFSAAHFEKYAETMAMGHEVSSYPIRGVDLVKRVAENENVLIESFKMIAQTIHAERAITPAAEWLIDNFYIVEEQIKDIRDHLPIGFYKELPKLVSGEFKDYPRVYAIAWEFVAHTDSLFDPELLKSILKNYQSIRPLTMGELWAISITLRIVLVENLRRLSARIVGSQIARAQADHLADELLGLWGIPKRTNKEIIESLREQTLSIGFAVQLVQRLRFQEEVSSTVLSWLDKRLKTLGLEADKIVQDVHTGHTAANITVRNIITSMKLMSSLDWRDFFEQVSLVNIELRGHPLYEKMDFITRDKYRHSIEELSRQSKLTELQVASALVSKIESEFEKSKSNNQVIDEKRFEMGYYLISNGRYEFEADIHYKLKFRNRLLRFYIAHRELLYFGGIFLLTYFFVSFCLTKEHEERSFLILFALGLMGLFPASELAISLINRFTNYSLIPRHLPRLDFSKVIPSNSKTFVVVPTMLINHEDILGQVEQLEVHYLSNPDDSVFFAILSDWRDATTEHLETDDLILSTAINQINYLNTKYKKNSNGKNRFYLFHRYRLWNESEQKWLGFERKRGKLQEFNRFLRGAKDTSFIHSDEIQLDIPNDIVYVITLDADTKMPRGVVGQLVGTLAHPLNHPKFDLKLNRVVEGYGILQPRITPTLPVTVDSTFFQRLSSGPCGIDPYAAAVSDVYQDLFGEGSYTGKGIYNVDVFEKALIGRTPDNRLLSHDLFEGNFARCALLSDVELFEDFPSNFEVAVVRTHRWTRGDWQLLPWILGREGRSISIIGRWKMIDNLRRSLLSPMIFFLLLTLFATPKVNIAPWMFLCLTSLALPHLFPFFSGLCNYHKKIPLINQLRTLGEDLFLGLSRFVLNLIFIPYHSWVQLDAIFRTLLRLGITKRKLLEWTTSAQSKSTSSNRLQSFIVRMMRMQVTLLILGIITIFLNSYHWSLFIPLILLWLFSSIIAWKISLPPEKENLSPLGTEDLLFLRSSARQIWLFFTTFVTEEEHYLPPDNFQEDPAPVIAHRSSPTNFGLYLLSIITARDFGWIGLHEMIERLENTLFSMQSLPRHNGHFFNWYGTIDMAALEPRYISSVDNGNLAGHLIAVAQTCEEMTKKLLQEANCFSEPLSSIHDGIRLLVKQFSKNSATEASAVLSQLIKQVSTSYDELLLDEKKYFWEKVLALSQKLVEETAFYGQEIYALASAIDLEIKSHFRDFFQLNENDKELLQKKLINIAKISREILIDMNFNFLYNPTRKLFSIGYSMNNLSLDPSYYDLLASESRLLSFVAIAKGDVPVDHWFSLGRALTKIDKGTALISWSGSMFEYLMPSLVMHTPTSSLLEQTCRLIVKKQIDYANLHSLPWGMSESAYNTRDLHLTYQYSNFGVPDLAFKRGVGKDLVISPYATVLAGMYDQVNAVNNLKRLVSLKMVGLFGFYESIDYTKSRVPENETSCIVKTYMAHHQGMSLVSISNMIHDNIMLKRFHLEPIVQASELLLQERTPRNIAVAASRVDTVKIEHVNNPSENNYRQYFSPYHKVPRTHLLSNGLYAVMITTAGSGYSRFRELAVTRWREDVTRDNWGSYIFLRDLESEKVWSAGYHPTCVDTDNYEVLFTEDRARITRDDYFITSQLEVFISPEDNAEIRRQSLRNNGSKVRYVEVTTYSEIVLNSQNADIAHPTFSNLFIQTEYIPEINSIIATRRPRSSSESQIWMAYVIAIDANAIEEIEYETDRTQFIGRGRSIRNPIALSHKKLSNTTGAVLDPMMSFRSMVRLDPGATATITYSTILGNSREEIMVLAERFHEANSYERTSNLAWTQAQVQLNYLGIDHSEANLFQQLANRILYLDSTLRVSSDILKRNIRNATNLWAYGISGDYPIVLVRIDDIEQRNFLRQLLRAHEYWGTKRLVVDLVILNEKASSYSQELHEALSIMVSSSSMTSRTFLPETKGRVFLLRADVIPDEDRNLFQTAARAILVGPQGNLAEQVKRMVRKIDTPFNFINARTSAAKTNEMPLQVPSLEFFNGVGGFANGGSEYVIHLKNNQSTPAPWINVIANSQFGFHVSESGAGSTWSKNSRENQLTPWSNDPVSDPSGECFYLYDHDTLELWSPTLSPIRVKNAEYLTRHGQGYSQFETRHNGIHSTLIQFVHTTESVKISKLVLKNELNYKRHLTITSYIEWVLGFSRSVSSNYLITSYDKTNDSLLCYNPWSQEFGTRIAFATFLEGNTSWSGNRTEFIGRNGNMRRPHALLKNENLSGEVGAGLDSCAAIKKNLTIEANQEITVVFILCQTESLEETSALIEIIKKKDIDQIFSDAVLMWNNILQKVQIQTPDSSMNIMLNSWLLYQTTVCRLWARSAFYQAGGAFGFRDQLQDSMAVVWTKPEMIRAQIIRAASRQFLEGDVQHWWHMPSGRGVRTHFSDDLLWLPYVVSYYLKRTEDYSILDVEVPFIKGPLLSQDHEDSYYTPEVTNESASVYHHCVRALLHSLAVGVHGLPLMGGGDWNDGMNRVGAGGKGESVWLAWFLISNLREFAKVSELRGDNEHALIWLDHIIKIENSIEIEAWDGDWYKRAFFDDGTPLGSSQNTECTIDSLAQTWAVISKAGDHVRSVHAMESLEKYLVKKDEKIVLLFTPPFDKTPNDPGYIKGYLPGVRENGGQYSHAAIWCVLAFAELNLGKKAVDLFSLINPINHSRTLDEANIYKVEPYVIAADVYSVTPHIGRGGWTWYTGSSGWMYTTGLEAILGFKLAGNKLTIDPCIDPQWKSYKITYLYFRTTYKIEVLNPNGLACFTDRVELPTVIELIDDGATHNILVEIK